MAPRTPAPDNDVAQVLPLVRTAHLDRLFDYRVPAELADDCVRGVKVRIRFSGRLVDGLVYHRTDQQTHHGSLAFINKVVTPSPVVGDHMFALIDKLAVRYGAITQDVIRAAVPPRIAAAEKSDFSTPWQDLGQATEPDLSPWALYRHGTGFVDAVLAGKTVRAAWQIAPGHNPATAVAALAAKTAMDGGGVLVVVPDKRHLDRVERELKKWVGAKQITVLHSALGDQARYRRFLSIASGQSRLVIGTRSAAFAPVANLRLAVIIDDGNDNLVNPRSPYDHAREVVTTRSALTGCALVLGGISRTAEVQMMVESGWAHDLLGDDHVLRAGRPVVRAAADSVQALHRDPRAGSARLPSVAYQAVKKALANNTPALVQVPRAGYVPSLGCGSCFTPARCAACNGPVGYRDGGGVLTCRWCGRPAANWRCPECGSVKLRAQVKGVARTAEELGRAFAPCSVVSSGSGHVIDSVDGDVARVVVATPGAEPVATGPGYGAVLLLDTWALLGRDDLRAEEKALRHWLQAAFLARPADAGGEVVVVAEPHHRVVQHLIRFDPVGAARRELADRAEVGFPPAVHMAVIDAPQATITEFAAGLDLPEQFDILGPVDLPRGVGLPGHWDDKALGVAQRLIVRCPGTAADRTLLGGALRAARVLRAVTAPGAPLRIQVDPLTVG